MNLKLWEKIHKWVVMLGAGACILIGLIGLIGWHFSIPSLLQVISGHAAIRYNAAFLFLLAGGCLYYNLFVTKGFNLPRFLAFIFISIGILTIIQYQFNLNLSVDTFLIGLFVKKPLWGFSLRVTFLGAISFVLMGIVFLIFSPKKFTKIKSAFITILGLVIINVGILGFISFLIPIETNIFNYKVATAMSFWSACSYFFMGLSFISLAGFYNIKNNINFFKVRPLLTGATAIILSILIAFGLYVEKVHLFEQFFNNQLSLIKTTIIQNFEQEINNISDIVKELEANQKSLNEHDWEKYSNFYMLQHSEIKAIYLLDNDFKEIKAISSQKENVKQSFELNENIRQKLSTPFEDNFLIQYDSSKEIVAFITSAEIRTNQKGFFVVISDSKKLFDELLSTIKGDFQIDLFADKERIYEFNTEVKPDKFWVWQDVINVHGLDLTIKIFPSEALVLESLNKASIVIVFSIGFIVAFFLWRVSALIEKSRLQVLEITKIKNYISEYKDRLSLAIKGGKISSWVIDLKTQEISWDEYAYVNFFGRDPDFILPKNLAELLKYIHPQDQRRFEDEIKMYGKEVLITVFRVIYPEGKARYLNTKCTLFYDKEGNPYKLAGVCIDITKEKIFEIILEVQMHIAKILSEAVSVDEAIIKLIQLLGEALDLAMVNFWKKDNALEVIKLQQSWNDPNLNLTEFISVCKNHPFAKGEGFPGEVWEHKRAIWFQNVKEQCKCKRIKKDDAAVLKSAFGYPISYNGNFVGVFEVFNKTFFVEEINEYLLYIADYISYELGRFLSRKKAEESQSQLAAIILFAREPIFVLDLVGKIITWNKGAEQTFGFLESEIIGKSIETLFAFEKQSNVNTLVEKIKGGLPILNLEIDLHGNNGKKITGLMTISPMKKENMIIGACVIIQDITELKLAQEENLKNQKKYQIFLESASDWFWAMDKNRKITFSSPSIKTILGYEPEEVIGMDMFLLLGDENIEETKKEFLNHLDNKKGWLNKIARWKTKGGSIKWLECSGEPMFDENNNQ
ncbi:MAG: PAS domain S-box protein [Chlamydiae bacterium]|nr:PAS domain S-box protein [Chlamydiota bacterium]